MQIPEKYIGRWVGEIKEGNDVRRKKAYEPVIEFSSNVTTQPMLVG